MVGEPTTPIGMDRICVICVICGSQLLIFRISVYQRLSLFHMFSLCFCASVVQS
jgi:hypothetical protein